MPSHYINQCWFIVSWSRRNKLQWNFNWNTKLFIHENAFTNVFCKMVAILYKGDEISWRIDNQMVPISFFVWVCALYLLFISIYSWCYCMWKQVGDLSITCLADVWFHSSGAQKTMLALKRSCIFSHTMWINYPVGETCFTTCRCKGRIVHPLPLTTLKWSVTRAWMPHLLYHVSSDKYWSVCIESSTLLLNSHHHHLIRVNTLRPELMTHFH